MQTDKAAAELIETVVAALQPGFAVTLWNGRRLGPTIGPSLVIRDPGSIRRLALRPRLDTLIELWIAGAIDVADGSLFDIADRRPEGRFKQRLKALPKRRLLRLLPALLLGGEKKAVGPSGLEGRTPFVAGSDRAAIEHHYDVSNAFYQLFLDERMLYSCGYFTNLGNTIDQAQEDKLDHICRKLRLQPGDRLLDIGCGWGAMLIHAATRYGVSGTGITLSEAQATLARQRIRDAGLDDRITIENRALDTMTGSFDKISSIGMFEHVGIANHAAYFATVRRLLVPGGVYLHHAITRRRKRQARRFRRKSPEHRALVKYIFPGGELDHLAMTIGNLEAHGFEVHDVENLREHYGQTCRLWAERLEARFDEAVAEIGRPKARLWLLYLTGCALAFERGTVQINQTVATRRQRGPSGLPLTRDDLYSNAHRS